MLEGPVHAILNRLLDSYVSNFDASQLKLGLWAGDAQLKNLRLRKEALDKFRLPIDVVEGYIGNLRLQVPWNQLGSRPIKAYVDTIYLLAVPAASTKYDAEEDERRAQALKQEKLANAEVLSGKSSGAMSSEEQAKNESFLAQMINRAVDNLQIEVKNIHIRYEDSLSVPGHPFAVGVTLAGFKAFSTDDSWLPSFVQNTKSGVHKIAELDSLAVYFNTDTGSLAGYEPDEAITKFKELIATSERTPEHQFVLKPVSGKGKLIMRKHLNKGEAKQDLDLNFDELAFVLDEDQYRDALSMVDLFHFYTRQHQYRPLRPPAEEIEAGKAKALLRFAMTAIRREVHEKHRRWTWDYFRERRDDRKEYVRLFKLSSNHQLQDRSELDALERKLDYKDIRFYRSIARSELGKERAIQRQEERDHPPPPVNRGWVGWIWGGPKQPAQNEQDEADNEVLSEGQRKELYNALDWDENAAAVSPDLDLPPEATKLRICTDLRKGSFALRRKPRGADPTDLVSVVFDAFRATLHQRVQGLVASVALGGVSVFDGTRPGTRHPQIVRVKEDKTALLEVAASERTEGPQHVSADHPFFFAEFENRPLDGRADVALNVRMRFLEIIYHRGYVESIVGFFKPPESQLESVGALIDVASETLEGIRKETRAGLEYALDKHRTVDLRVDMNAPIIVVPEDVTLERCQHIVLDAGHIAVESELVDKSRLNEIRAKQSRQYSDKDFQQLEDLMYDKFFVRLDSAQLLMGETLEACLQALEGHSGPELHVLERISMTFKAENCILPKAPNLTRLRVSGELPDLRVNFSDRKYKILMRMIDVAIPKFDSVDSSTHQPAPAPPKPNEPIHRRKTSTFVQAPMYLTGRDREYTVDDDEDAVSSSDEGEVFELAPDIVEGSGTFKQKTFGFSFTVKKLVVSIFKTDQKADKADFLLACANLEGFSLDFALRAFDMTVDILLRSLYIEDKMVDDGSRFHRLVTSDQSSDESPKDLVQIKYARVQPNSPEFMTVHEGINQNVEIELATINVILTRASILMLFDFILTTFTNPDAPPSPDSPQAQQQPSTEDALASAAAVQKLRVRVRLTSFVLILNDDGLRIATFTAEEGDVGVLLRGPTMRVTARLGNLALTDDIEQDAYIDPAYKRLLAIEGDQVADFAYETYDPNDTATYPGHDSLVHLRTGSVRIHFLEQPVQRILRFLMRFARMKAVLDSARNAAAAQAADMQARGARMRFDVLIRTPILVFPRSQASHDRIIANLGEISARNRFAAGDQTVITAGLHSIRLASRMGASSPDVPELQILEDLNFDVDIAMYEGIDRSKELAKPDTHVTARLSDVKMNLTQAQYGFVMNLLQTLPGAFSTEADEDEPWSPEDSRSATPALPSQPDAPAGTPANGAVDLLPELPDRMLTIDGKEVKLWTKMEVAFHIKSVVMELFGPEATTPETLEQHSLARFNLHRTELRFKSLSNDAMEAELALRTFTIRDTHPSRQTKYRDIVPASKHDGHQFMLSYTQTGGLDRSSVANLTIDSPTFIFTLEPLFALAGFFTSAFTGGEKAPAEAEDEVVNTQDKTPEAQGQQSGLSYRVNIVAAQVMLLADPTRTDSEAVSLSVGQILLSQQTTMLLSVKDLGMFLCKMSSRNDKIRLLDSFDLTVALDSSARKGRSMTMIDINIEPLVFRVSYRDIMLVTSIANRASELAGNAAAAPPAQAAEKSITDGASAREVSSRHRRRSSAATATARRSRKGSKPAQVQYISATEELKATLSGFQLILIGDIHELPILDVKTGKLMLRASEWSKELRADVIISPYINFFNLSTSHWEPLLDPWEFVIHVGKRLKPAGMDIEVSAKKRAEINVTATFIDLALTTMAVWTRERDSVMRTDRGHGAPFLVKNRTGYKVLLWNASDVQKDARATPTELENGRDTPWRFDDWKTMRENLSVSSHNALSMMFDGVAWDRVRSVAVDREGEHIYALKPKLDGVLHRMLCEIKLVDNVKVVTLRSTMQVQNLTLVPAEMVVVDEKGKKDSAIFKIPPGGEASVPIESAYAKRIRVRPDAGFGFNWSEVRLHWQDMVKRPARTIICTPREEGKDVDFRFQSYAVHDKNDPMIRHYPRISLRLRPPMEIENLLPFDIKYRIYDKNLERNFTSFLRKGGLTPISIADLSHLMLLSIEIEDTNFKRSDFAIVNTDNPDDMPVETYLTLEDRDGLQMNMAINYHKYPQSGGAFKIQLFSPYAVINKTGLDFALKTKAPISSPKNVAGMKIYTSDPARREQRPYLFNFPAVDRRNRALLSMDGSDFSRGISFETVGADNAFSMPSPRGDSEIHVGMKVMEGLGAYKLTKVVTIYPRFIIKNALDEAIRVRSFTSQEAITIAPGQRRPIFWLPTSSEAKMSLSFENSSWSPLFSMQEIGRVHLRAQDRSSEIRLVTVDALLEGPTVFLRIGLETGRWPFLLRNETDVSFSFSQAQADTDAVEPKQYELPAGQAVPYAWDEPIRDSKRLRLRAPDGSRRDVSIMEIGSQVPFRFKAGARTRTLSMDIKTEETTQVLLLTNYVEEKSVFKMQRRNSEAISRQASLASVRDIEFEAAETESITNLSFSLNLAGVGISIVDRRLRELVYVSFRGLKVDYKDQTDKQSIGVICQWIQIDNQLRDCLFPIIFYPSRAPKDEADLQAHPNLQLSVILLKDQAHGVLFFKYATILLQEMSIEVDEGFLYAAMDFAKFKGASWEEPVTSQLTDEPAEIPEPAGVQAESMVFFETLHLQPFQIEVSFMRTESSDKQQKTFLDNRNPVAYALNALTMALGNVNEAPVQLNALFIENVRLSWPVLSERIMLHYRQEVVGQLYRVLGSADFIGNPVGLFKNVTSGVTDLWYEPVAGIALYGDRDIPFGVARGAGNFVRKSVFGVTDSFAKVTGSIGKGLSAASLDSEWQAKRRAQMRRNKPKHAIGGLGIGAQSFVTGVASGMEGVLRQPIEGLENEGATGLVKGMGKGFVGLFAKPAVGVFDFLSNTAAGVRNTTTLFEGGSIERVRLPRFIASDGVLRPYSEREALGQSWLHGLGFRYENETYVAHLVLGGQDDTAVVVTETRILLIQSIRQKVMWDVPLSDLKTISMEPKGLQMGLRTGDNGPFLPITSEANRDWLFSHMRRVVQAYNNLGIARGGV